ncbi:MAG TPA: hypothetical protein VGS10_11125 [Terracidiphilus sp.]|nr:hypothetical protein [Terracidiphilus sp.]
MFPSENSHSIRIVSVVAALVILAICTGAVAAQENDEVSLNQALTAGPNRPANVPQGYVLTPFGYFDPSCVQKIAEGETLLADGRVKHRDGTVAANVPVCRYPRYDRHGVAMVSGAPAQINPEASGWIENANVATGSAKEWYSGLVAFWVVPPQPPENNGQVLFYFPGLEDINDTLSILQPVLQWAGGQWAMANWNCCLNNITTESTVIPVQPNDRIIGTIAGDCRSGRAPCASWTVFSFDADSGESTTLKHTPSDGQVFNWAFGGVMEPYYVVSCDDYPADTSLAFDVLLFDRHLRPIRDPSWSEAVNTTVTPQCNYGVKASDYEVQVDY